MDKSADPRAIAWQILRRVEEEQAFADALLGRALSTHGLEARDQALLTRLVYGTLAWQGYLDHLIAAFSRRPPAQLDPPVRSVLRLALFQICLLSKIPPFAAVDTAVELVKQFRGGAAVSLVNAVLRRAATGWQQVRLPSRDADPIAYLSTRWSHPRWLVERWVARYGATDTEALLQANNEPAPTMLRVNRHTTEPAQLRTRLRDAGFIAEPAAYSPVGIRVEHAGTPASIPGYADGLFSLQGEASQLTALLVGAQPGQRVLDACAAPGGKTTHLAELMDDRGEIVALDTNRRALERLDRMARRLRLSIIKTAVADAATWAGLCPRTSVSGSVIPAKAGIQAGWREANMDSRFRGNDVPPNARNLAQGPWEESDGFDCVLVDAPCSGLGTLRQHPEIKWRRTPEDVGAAAHLQRRLLDRLAAHVRSGGALVYSTCTISHDENEDVLAAFLSAHPEFSVDDPRPLLPAQAHVLVGDDHVLRTWPHRHGLDGFFAVRLKAWRHRDIVRP